MGLAPGQRLSVAGSGASSSNGLSCRVTVFMTSRSSDTCRGPSSRGFARWLQRRLVAAAPDRLERLSRPVLAVLLVSAGTDWKKERAVPTLRQNKGPPFGRCQSADGVAFTT